MSDEVKVPIGICWACSAELKAGQKICTNCENWQGYRRFYNISSMTLALIISLISVISVLGPSIVEIFSKKISDIDIAGIFVSGLVKKGDGYFGADLLMISASNQGNKSANLPSALRCQMMDDVGMIYLDAIDPTLVLANASVKIQYKERFFSAEPSVALPDGTPIDRSGIYKCPIEIASEKYIIVLNYSQNVSGDHINFPIMTLRRPTAECEFDRLTSQNLDQCVKRAAGRAI